MWSVYTKQFEPGAWVVLVFLILSLVLSLFVVSWWSIHEVKLSISDSALAVVGALLSQGSPLNFQTAAGRTVVLTTLFLQVLTLAFYTSNLVSALAAGPPLPVFKNLQDIHNEKSFTFGFLRSSSNANDFRLKDEDLVASYTVGMERVLREKYALLISEVFYALNFGRHCKVFMLPAVYFPNYLSFALPKDSPLVPILNKVVVDILSAGLMRKWWLETYDSNTKCNLLETAPIELKTVLTPFLLLGLSILLVLGVLAGELVVSRRALAKDLVNRQKSVVMHFNFPINPALAPILTLWTTVSST
ncbi:probable glutamate receptor [Penaeus chinensis]|uniref:probable glutamate receptor n=1 Tax=Penaeus chinensis TaxID=139456 RepID=UPI001FB7D33D|nr:probable glutamate receptor [Penaeus chinensis]